MIEFQNDDEGYLVWVAENRKGYVLNVRQTPDADYVVLHRAGCGSIVSKSRTQGAYTARGFRKIWAKSANDLKTAAKKEGRNDGSFSKRCGLCHP